MIKVQVFFHNSLVVFLYSLSRQELQFYLRLVTGIMEEDWKEKMLASARGRFDEAYQRASSVYVPAFPVSPYMFFLSLHFVGSFSISISRLHLWTSHRVLLFIHSVCCM